MDTDTVNNEDLIMPILLRPLFLRSYKAFCTICDGRTYVHNPERTGGICVCCEKRKKAVMTISQWYRKIVRQRERLQAMLVVMRRTNTSIRYGGVAPLVSSYL